MSGQHTPGRLEFRVNDPATAYELFIPGGDGVTATVQRSVDARRLAACWNAFDGVDTDKIEGKTAAEYVCGEAYLTGMHPGADGFNIGMSGLACQLLADSFAGQFKGSGAINFLEVGFTHPETGDLLVTMQRVEGETPAQQKAVALRELASVRAELDAANGAVSILKDFASKDAAELAAARALLREVLEDCDQVRQTNCARGMPHPPILEARADRIRSYLDACDTLGGPAS